MHSIGEKIKSLRQSRNLKQGDLAKRLGMTSAQLCRIEGGRHVPSVKTLSRLAKALSVSLTDLMVETIPKQSPARPCSSDEVREYTFPELEIPGPSDCLNPIRETAETPNDLRGIKRQLLQKDLEYSRLENDLGIVSATNLQLSYPISVDERGAEILARTLRVSCDAGSTPFSDLVGLLESRNVRIVLVKTSSAIQSRSFFNTSTHVLMLAINKRLPPERQLYRIAYELGYTCLYASTGYMTVHETPAIHKFVRRFAAAFLMPEDTLRALAAQLALGPTNWTMQLLLQLKYKFSVSAETFAFRLEKLGLLAQPLRKRFKEELRNYYEEHNNAEPAPIIKPLSTDIRLELLKLRAAT